MSMMAPDAMALAAIAFANGVCSLSVTLAAQALSTLSQGCENASPACIVPCWAILGRDPPPARGFRKNSPQCGTGDPMAVETSGARVFPPPRPVILEAHGPRL